MDIINEMDLTNEDKRTLVKDYGFDDDAFNPAEYDEDGVFIPDEALASKEEERYRKNFLRLNRTEQGLNLDSLSFLEYRLRYGSLPRF